MGPILCWGEFVGWGGSPGQGLGVGRTEGQSLAQDGFEHTKFETPSGDTPILGGHLRSIPDMCSAFHCFQNAVTSVILKDTPEVGVTIIFCLLNWETKTEIQTCPSHLVS